MRYEVWSVAALAAAGMWVSAALAQGVEEPAAAEESLLAEEPGFWDGWTGSVDLGINGSSGNTETFNFRGAVGVAKDTPEHSTSAGITYSVKTSDSETTENRLELNGRRDWKFEDSAWRFFVLGKLEFDEFQAWDGRASLFAGPGYVFVENEKTFLMGRVGVGGAYEFGGSQDDDFIPEALLGADFTHQLTERQSIYANLDFYPSLEDIGPYRAVAKAGWQVTVDPETNLVLKIGVEDRYDSSPGGQKRNDVDYFATLGWTF